MVKMKAILISIRPQWVEKILNKKKTIEVRKRFPKDYVGWVYIYCTNNGGNFAYDKGNLALGFENGNKFWEQCRVNGKVVARFWCDNVDEFYDFDDDLCKQACLDRGEMLDYLGNKNGYAIHITKLEIFDKPKEISEFKRYINDSDCKKCAYGSRCPLYPCDKIPLTRAPQSYQFIEI